MFTFEGRIPEWGFVWIALSLPAKKILHTQKTGSTNSSACIFLQSLLWCEYFATLPKSSIELSWFLFLRHGHFAFVIIEDQLPTKFWSSVDCLAFFWEKKTKTKPSKTQKHFVIFIITILTWLWSIWSIYIFFFPEAPEVSYTQLS